VQGEILLLPLNKKRRELCYLQQIDHVGPSFFVICAPLVIARRVRLSLSR
jgi:hypothetical protein